MNTGLMPTWTERMAGVLVGVVLVGVVLVGSCWGVVLGQAAAVPAGGATAAGMVADREDLEILVTPREPRPDVFVLKGRMKPEYRKQEAILQRRNCGTCSWFGFETFETDRESRFKLRVPTPEPEERRRICYRVKVPRSDQYRRAISISNCIGGLQSSPVETLRRPSRSLRP